jgi:hypothetical protein
MQVLQRPGQDRVGGVEDPLPRHQAECDRRRPGEQDQEAEDPLAREIAQHRVRDQPGADEDDRLRDDGEQERVPDGMLEGGVPPLAPEVLQPDVLAMQTGRRVREAQPDRERERARDEHRDEDDGGRDQYGRKDTRALEDIAPAPRPGPSDGGSLHRGPIINTIAPPRWPRSRSSS